MSQPIVPSTDQIDLEAMEKALREIEVDPRRAMTMRQPMRAALLLALLRPVDELAARADPEYMEERVTGIVAIAEALVRQALKGDSNAFDKIADRIEGKVGTRKGEQSETDEVRHEVQQTIVGVVEALTKRKLMTTSATDAEVIEQPGGSPSNDSTTR